MLCQAVSQFPRPRQLRPVRLGLGDKPSDDWDEVSIAVPCRSADRQLLTSEGYEVQPGVHASNLEDAIVSPRSQGRQLRLYYFGADVETAQPLTMCSGPRYWKMSELDNNLESRSQLPASLD